MWAYTLRRIALGIVVLLGLTLVTFLIARVVPSDPAARWMGPRATAEQIGAARVKLGLDKPLYVQYLRYMADMARGDLGTSIRTHQPVRKDLAAMLPATVELVVVGMVLAVLVGIPLGVLSAMFRDSPMDHLGRVVSVTSVSLPTFWLAMILQLVFFKSLGILPLADRVDSIIKLTYPLRPGTGFYLLDSLLQGNWPFFHSTLAHLMLPAVTLAAYPAGLVARMIRSSMLEVYQEDYIRLGRAFGFSESLITFRYALRNALAPALTVIALTFAYSLGSTFLVEAVFNWPGMGKYAADAVTTADYPAIMGVTIFIAALYVALNILVDIAQAVLDPRVQLS